IKSKYLSLKAYTKANALVGLSNKIVSKLKEQFPDKNCVRIPSSPVSYPVNQNKVDQIWSAHAHKTLVLQASYLGKDKGHDVTIVAAKLVAKYNSPVHLLLPGNGSEAEDLTEQDQGLKDVFFMSHPAEMRTWFASANLFIHPS